MMIWWWLDDEDVSSAIVHIGVCDHEDCDEDESYVDHDNDNDVDGIIPTSYYWLESSDMYINIVSDDQREKPLPKGIKRVSNWLKMA